MNDPENEAALRELCSNPAMIRIAGFGNSECVFDAAACAVDVQWQVC